MINKANEQIKQWAGAFLVYMYAAPVGVVVRVATIYTLILLAVFVAVSWFFWAIPAGLAFGVLLAAIWPKMAILVAFGIIGIIAVVVVGYWPANDEPAEKAGLEDEFNFDAGGG